MSDAVGEIAEPPPPLPPPVSEAEPFAPTPAIFPDTAPGGHFPRATHIVRESQIVSSSTLALTATAIAAVTGGAGALSGRSTGPTAAVGRRRNSVLAGAVSLRGRLVSVLPNGQDDEVHWLETEQIDLGRTEGDVRFDDPQLAPRHARLNLTLGGAMLTPLDGRNGVYLRIRMPTDLNDGDYVLIGRQVLKFEVLSAHERHPRPAMEDGVILFGTPAPAAWGRVRQFTSSGIGRDVYHLSRPLVTLGREQVDLVFLDDEFLSRRHAQIALEDDRPVLSDLGSSNGTYVRLRAPHVLVPGDMLRLGDQLLRFELG